VVDEIFFITREALTNSFRHSHASAITIALKYLKDRFTLVCRDNGCGFDPGQLGESGGHWGLRGMVERAERIGASFKLESAPGEGTRIRVDLPASRAYLRPNGFRAFLRRQTTYQ
jgi:signal transduction histidine kinase